MLIGIIILITVLSLSAVSAATISDSNLSNNKNTSITKSDTIITKNTDIVSNSNNNKIYEKLSNKDNVKTTTALNKNLPKYTRTTDPNPTPTPTPVNRNSVSMVNILNAASFIKNYIDVNKKLPDSVIINGFKYSMAEYSYLISKLVYNINIGKTSNIILDSVANPSGPEGDNAVGNMIKADYIDLAKRCSEFIKNNNQAPNYAKAVIGSKNINMPYQTIIYGLSIILDQTKETGTLQDSLDIDVLKNSTINKYNAIYIGPSKVSDKYNGESLAQYLVATKNCQVNNSAIKSMALSLTKGLNTDAEKAVAIFNYVRDKVIYRFYYDTKKGAIGTLSAKRGNCVDHAHLLIAMYRSIGLAARYVHGTCKFVKNTYGHVWAQVLVGDTWTIIDPTSKRNTFGVINNWNTNTYSLKGKYSSLGF